MGLSGSKVRKLVLANDSSSTGSGKELPPEFKQMIHGNASKPKSDTYWDDRTKALQHCHDEITHVMEEEYQKAFQEMGGKQPGKKSSYVPCAADTKRMISCYKRHPDQPMLCADIFKDFEDCVTRERIDATECGCGETCDCD